MIKKTFKKGGVHPPDMKYLSKSAAIDRVDAPSPVAIPVSQHIGAPAKAVVSVGDSVKKGQVIAEAGGFVSVPIHASVSGKVIAIENRPTVIGKICSHIVIESDGKNEWMEGCNVRRSWMAMSPDDIRAAIRDAGVVGMGGATFPTHVKLSPPKDKAIDTVILNGAECEPYLTCDYRVMMERPDDVVEGLKIIMRTLGVKNGMIGVEANKPDAYAKLREVSMRDDEIDVFILEVKYPQGAEKQLIDALLGRMVPPGKLPLDVGVVVQNVGTACAVRDAVAMSMPLIERVVTITGDAIENPANLLVPIGMSVADILCRQGVDENTKKLILGGPMMGISVPSADYPVIKGTSGILALKKIPDFMPGPCIRCGKCVSVCPLRGMTAELVSAIEAGQVERYAELHVLDCVECGSCAFVCPSHRTIVHHVKKAKAEYAAWKAANKEDKQNNKG